ncbi:PadR family transcriptional regulator [Aminipila terrae]|uniref:PadR family transcriptional regulator n=1 Tax=Aminipila terrae TaxID=2697030 RepID=A0A6P1MMR6_9FIRM|nr:helix-turn-helix transcriptional regulator [Aminipila terrae]QHI72956.1 PadR family transcriptional regulator [Aminipila terrae]
MFIDMNCPCQGKNLDKMLQPLILCILAEGGDMHGFALLREIGKMERFADSKPDATGVYRYLKKMESSGLLTSKWDMEDDGSGNPKRIFSITTQGKACLANWSVALYDYNQYIDSLIDMINKAVSK